MKINQTDKPLYWVLHKLDSTDVYIETASKTYRGCLEKIKSRFDDESIRKAIYENDEMAIDLFEIDFYKPSDEF